MQKAHVQCVRFLAKQYFNVSIPSTGRITEDCTHVARTVKSVVEISRIAATKALNSLSLYPSDPAFDDMQQEASRVILRDNLLETKDAAYAYVAAYHAALAEYFRLQYEQPRPDRQRILLSQLNPDQRESDPDSEYQELDAVKIYDLLLSTRKRPESRRAREATARDTYICVLLSRGYTSREISEEMSIPFETVRCLRNTIKRRLRAIK